MGNVLLDLDTLVVRPKIRIDGEPYEILSPDELPVLTTHMFGIKGNRMDALMAQAELAPAEAKELRGLVLEISDAIMEPIPAKIRKKLSEAHRNAVIQTFGSLLLNKKAGAAAALMKTLLPVLAELKGAEQLTGESQSPASSDSTEGPQDGGSPKPQSPS